MVALSQHTSKRQNERPKAKMANSSHKQSRESDSAGQDGVGTRSVQGCPQSPDEKLKRVTDSLTDINNYEALPMSAPPPTPLYLNTQNFRIIAKSEIFPTVFKMTVDFLSCTWYTLGSSVYACRILDFWAVKSFSTIAFKVCLCL